MPFSEKISKNHTTKYLILIISIILIFGISTTLLVNFSKTPIRSSGKIISPPSTNLYPLDQCIFKLYNAENNCRMYVATGNRSYYDQFNNEIRQVTSVIDTIEIQNQQEKASSPETLKGLMEQKKWRTVQFIQLRKLADSLINFSAGLVQDAKQPALNSKQYTARSFKNVVKIDTVQTGQKTKVKKKLFSRIIDAFSNKSAKGSDSTKATLVKTTITADTTAVGLAYSRHQLDELNRHYSKLYLTNRQLKDKEKELLTINHTIISAIAANLQQFKMAEQIYYNKLQSTFNQSATASIKNLDYLSQALILFAAALLIIVFFIVYKLYKNESQLIRISLKSQSYALSKSRFLANMSHEIRTPLNSIVGFSEQLSKSDIKPAQMEQISAIKSSSVMLLDVVNDILDFSKYETGKFALEKVPFSPYEAIKDVSSSIKILAEKKNILLIVEININKDQYIIGDPLRLKQVIMNLLSNAIKFTDLGSVTLQASLVVQQNNNCVIKTVVSDTGLGISAMDQSIIFDEFAQVYYSSTKKLHQGTGLGLAICKRIIETQGGNISVDSAINQGSTFSFEIPFPLTEQPKKKESLFNNVAELNQYLDGKKILLADDNMLNILLASTILKKYHLNFDIAHDGEEAYSFYLENEYDLILTDIQMPKMGGIELTEKIRALSASDKANVTIIGVTANVMQEDRSRYVQSGMNDIIIKPFKEQELLDTILKTLKAKILS